MDIATAAAVVGIPLAGVPALDIMVKSMKTMKPDVRVRKWIDLTDEIIKEVNISQGQIPTDILIFYTESCKRYLEVRNSYADALQKKRFKFLSAWFGKGKDLANDLIDVAMDTHMNGYSVSQLARFTSIRCAAEHGTNTPKNAEGRCSICFPPELESHRPMVTNMPSSRYIAEWLAMREVLKNTIQIMEIDGPEQSPLPQSMTDLDSADHDQLPPQYNMYSSDAILDVPIVEDQSASTELDQDGASVISRRSSLLSIGERNSLYSLARCLRLIKDAPPPEQKNVWESVADFRDNHARNGHAGHYDEVVPSSSKATPQS